MYKMASAKGSTAQNKSSVARPFGSHVYCCTYAALTRIGSPSSRLNRKSCVCDVVLEKISRSADCVAAQHTHGIYEHTAVALFSGKTGCRLCWFGSAQSQQRQPERQSDYGWRGTDITRTRGCGGVRRGSVGAIPTDVTY